MGCDKIQIDEKKKERALELVVAVVVGGFHTTDWEVNVYCFKSYEISWWLYIFIGLSDIVVMSKIIFGAFVFNNMLVPVQNS